MIKQLRRFLAPARHIERLPDSEVKRLYPRYRWRIMESTFLGYAGFYLVRNNFSVVAKDIEGALGYDHSTIGSILAITAISYGIGKFVMGSISDRSDPKKFMALGLLLTALCNFAFGSIGNAHLHMVLWALNGFVQGMGWPPCGRSMGHWFSVRERGVFFSTWNTSHNLGGGIAGILAAYVAGLYGWRAAFYFPAVIALIGSVYLFLRLRDTPQSVGLPPIEEYNNDFTEEELQYGLKEEELGTRELLVDYVLTNKFIWLLAIANFFAYIVRYSMLDWGPMYLREVKEATLTGGGFAILVIEFGGIPSTIFFGWLSDKASGRRGMIATLCMVPIAIAFAVIALTPPGFLWLDMCMLAVIGCFIYPVINLITIAALDLTSKKAIGAAAGFIGLFGYIGRTVQAKGFGWMVDYFEEVYSLQTAWLIVMYAILACAVVTTVVLATMWRLKPKA
ncbi:MAG: MFS transporter [Acidobacteria bacterium]|nr:MFS transporter [Candidatus Sulfomarinibacter kjeldsenii]